MLSFYDTITDVNNVHIHPHPSVVHKKNEIKINPTDETDEMISVVFSKTIFSVTMTLLSEGRSPGRLVFLGLNVMRT